MSISILVNCLFNSFFFFFTLAAVSRTWLCISDWGRGWERRRWPPPTSSCSGLSFALTSKPGGRRRTRISLKRGKCCLRALHYKHLFTCLFVQLSNHPIVCQQCTLCRYNTGTFLMVTSNIKMRRKRHLGGVLVRTGYISPSHLHRAVPKK